MKASAEPSKQTVSEPGRTGNGATGPGVSLAGLVIALYIVGLLAAVLTANGVKSEGPDQFDSRQPRKIVGD
jgi:hypothetical protein